MRIPYLAKSYILAIWLTGCGSKTDDSKDKQHLLSLERQWLEKEFALDTAFLSSIIDSTFMGISESGVKSKQEDLVSMFDNIRERESKGIRIDSFRLEHETVRIYENTAVVTFIAHTYRHLHDSLIERKTRFYDVWTKRSHHWKAVASQGVMIPYENWETQ